MSKLVSGVGSRKRCGFLCVNECVDDAHVDGVGDANRIFIYMNNSRRERKDGSGKKGVAPLWLS